MSSFFPIWLTLGWIHITFSHATIDIDCGQSSADIVAEKEVVSFKFNNVEDQDVYLFDSNQSFVPVLIIKDSVGQYVASGSVTNCDDKDCDGNVFMMNAMPRGEYILELVPDGNGGMFKVEMTCSSINGNETEYVDARRLFEDNELIDNLIDSLSDDEVSYFADLLRRGRSDEVLHSLRSMGVDMQYHSESARAVQYGQDYDFNDYEASPGMRFHTVSDGSASTEMLCYPYCGKGANKDIHQNYGDDILFGEQLVKAALCDTQLAHIMDTIAEVKNQRNLYTLGLLSKGSGRTASCGLFGVNRDGTLNDPHPLTCADGATTIKSISLSSWRTGSYGCGLGKSANAPFPIMVFGKLNEANYQCPYFLKRYPKKNGAANDYIAMKVAAWLNDIFLSMPDTIKFNAEPPIIKVFGIIPQYQPTADTINLIGKWVDDNGVINTKVVNMYFLSVFEKTYRGSWVNIKGEDKGTMNIESCCACHHNFINSLRGAFLMSMLLGAKDRHTDNVGIADECTIMNIDYGHFLGLRTGFETGLAGHYIAPINSILKERLDKIEVGDAYLQKAGISRTKLVADFGIAADGKISLFEVLVAALFGDVQSLKKHFQNAFDENKRTDASSKWSEFWSTKYFEKPEYADIWLSVVTKNEKHGSAISYMSYMLFGREGYKEGKAKIKPEYEAFKQQIEDSIPGGDWVVKATVEQAKKLKLRQIPAEEQSMISCL